MKSIYTKLLQDGTPSSKPLEQSDYHTLVKFIKFSFPKTFRVQNELETTMKRTFIIGRSEHKKKRKQKHSSVKSGQRELKKKYFGSIRILPRTMCYKDFLEVHSLWKSYTTELLKNDKSIVEIQSKLNRIDLHGAIIKVVQSKCESYVNLKGIVIKETKNTFVIVTKSNESKTLPKQDSVFELVLQNPNGVVQIAGNSFLTRPADRSSKKNAKSYMNVIGVKTYRAALYPKKK